MGFQPGDQRVVIGARTFTLRLTLGALSHISSRLSAAGPHALADAMRRIGPEEARVLLDCLLMAQPSSPRAMSAQADIDSSVAQLSDADVLVFVPAICAVFEESFDARL
ncbi:hypothetical protein [Fretibacter rubidus]|uniref:hypothetical protein n=1 Tax=Fretibacter rubidus TaxID=570162 RepID=UPI00352A02FF